MAKAKKPVYGEPGSVSWGTMNSEHLIPKFASLLESLATRAHNMKDLALVKDIYKRMEKPGYYRSEESDWDLNESLFDRLEAYAPPGHYFGSHPGDGSDYGFWQAEDDEYGGGKRRKAPKRRVSGGKRRSGKGRAAKLSGGYWTVIIPPAPYAQATEWHDTSGRAATLSRGAFATKAEATKWAKEKLRGAPYSLRKIGRGGKRRHAKPQPSRLGALVSDINRLTR